MKTSSSMKKLMEYAGSYRYLTYASYVLSAISALVALVPFWFIWNMIRRVLTAPDIRQAEGLGHNGWMAVIFALLSMVIYIAALWCSHLSAFPGSAKHPHPGDGTHCDTAGGLFK